MKPQSVSPFPSIGNKIQLSRFAYGSGQSFKKNSIRLIRVGLVLWLGIGMLVAGGCGEAKEEGAPKVEKPGVTFPAKLTFVVTNASKKTLTDVMIEGFTHNVKFTKVAGGETRTLLASKPMNHISRMLVSWAGPKGGKRSDSSVKGKIPKSFNGTLYFTIKESGKVAFRGGTM